MGNTKFFSVHMGAAVVLRLGVLGLVAMLAACQTTSTGGSASSSYLNSHALTEVVVSYHNVEEPLAVPGIERAFKKNLVGVSTAEKIATSLRFKNTDERRFALRQGINETIIPHVKSQVSPLFKGTRPMRAEVILVSAFLRSKFRNVTGLSRFQIGDTPQENQLIAGLTLYDVETGIPVQTFEPVKFTKDGSVTLLGGGPKAPPYNGPAPRFNMLSFEYAALMAQAIGQYSSSQRAQISAEEARTKTFSL